MILLDTTGKDGLGKELIPGMAVSRGAAYCNEFGFWAEKEGGIFVRAAR